MSVVSAPAPAGAARGSFLPKMPLSAQRGVLGAVLLIAAWEGIARGFDLPVYTLPAISKIFASIWTQRGVLTVAAGTTLAEALLGYLLGALIGIGGAVAVTMLPRVRRVVVPAATAFNSIPVIAWSPLVLLWFGMGMSSKIVMVALAISFTLFLSALSGLDRVDRRTVDLMRSFGAGRLAILWRLRLPTALPLMFAGLRVATARSVLVAVITEMLGATAGLGLLIYQAVVQVDFVQVWGAVFVASAASLVFFGLVSLAERRLVFWK
jgi:NitT/TauT family transport system permease protein